MDNHLGETTLDVHVRAGGRAEPDAPPVLGGGVVAVWWCVGGGFRLSSAAGQ